jgi:hypothetical protein
MNYPEASPLARARLCCAERGIKLKTVQADALSIISCNSPIALIFYVAANHIFIPVLPYRTSKISVNPKLSTPKLFLHLRAPAENLSGRQTLDHPNQFGNAVCRNALHQKMHMITVTSNFQKLNLIPRFNLKEHFLQYAINRFVYNHTSILRRKDQVIQKNRHIVTLMDEFAHPFSLLRERRGIRPKEIQTVEFW